MKFKFKVQQYQTDAVESTVAVFNGQKSGTKNTVDYAKRKGIRVMNVLDSI
mgnify:CR=1 FL=1